MDKFKELVRSAKSIAYSDIENKVREATSNEPWGPSSTLLAELAHATTFQNESYTEMVTMLWKRLFQEGQPRHTLKALHVVEFLLKRGHERFIDLCKRNFRAIADLERYRHIDEETGHDHGDAVRKKAAVVVNLLQDDANLAAERTEAERLAREDKFRGYSNETFDTRYRGGELAHSSTTAASSLPRTTATQQQRPRATADADADPFDAPTRKPAAAADAPAQEADPFGDEWSVGKPAAPATTTGAADPFADPFAAPAPTAAATKPKAAPVAEFDPFADASTPAPASVSVPAPVSVPKPTPAPAPVTAAKIAPIAAPSASVAPVAAPQAVAGDRRRPTATSQGTQATAAKQATSMASLNNDFFSTLNLGSTPATTSTTTAAGASKPADAFDIFGSSGGAAAAPVQKTNFDALFDAAQKQPQAQNQAGAAAGFFGQSQAGFGQPQPGFGQPAFGQPAFGQQAGMFQANPMMMTPQQQQMLMMQQQMMMQQQQAAANPFGGFGAPATTTTTQPDVFAAALYTSPTSSHSSASSSATPASNVNQNRSGKDAFASLEQFL